MAVMGAPRFYLFSSWDECIYGSRTTRDDYEVMAAVLNQLDQVIGCGADERDWVVDTRPRWRDDFLLSAVDVGPERRAWRFTPSLAGSSARSASGALVNGSVARLPADYIVPSDGPAAGAVSTAASKRLSLCCASEHCRVAAVRAWAAAAPGPIRAQPERSRDGLQPGLPRRPSGRRAR